MGGTTVPHRSAGGDRAAQARAVFKLPYLQGQGSGTDAQVLVKLPPTAGTCPDAERSVGTSRISSSRPLASCTC